MSLITNAFSCRSISTGKVPVDRAEERLQSDFNGARVLLVEDNPINREVVLALLQGPGLTVDTATDGLEALARVQGGRFDVILMDIQMPNLDGLEATRIIRSLTECDTTPIVAMTADDGEDIRQACADAGMDDFVPKPIDPDELFATLLRWLDESRYPVRRSRRR